MGGILADGVVSESELKGLSEWLMVHEDLKTCWPYDEIDSIVTAVMADQRIDDSEEGVKKRLAIFQKETMPVAEYYKEKNKLVEINGEQEVTDVFNEIVKNIPL